MEAPSKKGKGAVPPPGFASHPDLSLLQGRPEPGALSAQVYIVGLGIPEKSAATVEALDTLRRCRTIFVPDPDDGFFRRLCRDVRPHGVPVFTAEHEIDPASIEPVFEALSAEGPVAFAIYGHPLVYEPITKLLLEECQRRKVAVSAVSGLSAADAALSLLSYPLGPGQGLQIGDILHFCRQQADTRMAVFIYKVGMEPQNHAGLLRSLLASHPKNAPLALVERQNYGQAGDQAEWLSVGGLEARLQKPLSLYASLFLPPLIPSAPRGGGGPTA